MNENICHTCANSEINAVGCNPENGKKCVDYEKTDEVFTLCVDCRIEVCWIPENDYGCFSGTRLEPVADGLRKDMKAHMDNLGITPETFVERINNALKNPGMFEFEKFKVELNFIAYTDYFRDKLDPDKNYIVVTKYNTIHKAYCYDNVFYDDGESEIKDVVGFQVLPDTSDVTERLIAAIEFHEKIMESYHNKGGI